MESFTIPFPPRIGGHLALDFTNTAEFRNTAEAKEFLHAYRDVVAWCRHVELMSDAEAASLAGTAAQHPSKAATVFQRAIALRETLYAIAVAAINQEQPPQQALRLLNDELHEARQHQRLVAAEGSFQWNWQDTEHDLRGILWRLALSAADLLTSDQFRQVRQCPNCGWLFLDTSRNRMRRWCSMDYCGSKMKSRRQYQRKKAGHDSAVE